MVRCAAAEALVKTGSGAKAAIPVLIDWLKDAQLRATAAEVLGKIGPDAEPAIPALVEMLRIKD